MGDVKVTKPAILTEQAWLRKDLFYCQIIVALRDSLRFVLLLFSILRVGRPPRH